MTKEQEEQLNSLALRREELLRLVSLPGWKYCKDIASVFLSEYACRPGRTKKERIQWETYTTMKWLLDKTFTTAEMLAAGAHKTERPRRTIKR